MTLACSLRCWVTAPRVDLRLQISLTGSSNPRFGSWFELATISSVRRFCVSASFRLSSLIFSDFSTKMLSWSLRLSSSFSRICSSSFLALSFWLVRRWTSFSSLPTSASWRCLRELTIASCCSRAFRTTSRRWRSISWVWRFCTRFSASSALATSYKGEKRKRRALACFAEWLHASTAYLPRASISLAFEGHFSASRPHFEDPCCRRWTAQRPGRIVQVSPSILHFQLSIKPHRASICGCLTRFQLESFQSGSSVDWSCGLWLRREFWVSLHRLNGRNGQCLAGID